MTERRNYRDYPDKENIKKILYIPFDLTKKVELTEEEKIVCLKHLVSKHRKLIYCYEQTFVEGSGFNYKEYLSAIRIFVSSCDKFMNGELGDVIVNLSSIFDNDFEKKEFKKIVLENINILEYLLRLKTEDKVGESDGNN